jgi:predicted dithiol-disulfide oxidoreductase (DUF899 family)
MLLFDGPRQYGDLACAARRQRKPSLRRAHAGQRPQHRAKPPDLDPQPCAMGFVGALRSECPRDEHVPRCVSGPRLGQRAREREQHRTPCERDHRAGVTHDMTARVHDERPRRLQRLDLLEQEEALLAARNQARRGRVQHERCAFDLRRQRRDTRVAGGALGPSERSARRLRPQAPHRDPCNHQLVGGPRCWREGRGVELGERMLGRVKAPDQEEAPDLEIPRICGVHPVAMLFERRPRRIERLRRPAQVARDERDLGLGDDTPRPGHGFFRPERARRPSHESLRANKIAELRHRDAAQRERRRVVAQGDPVQCAEGITGGERTRRARDHRVHRNPATLVTPTVRYPVLIHLTTTDQHVVSRTARTTKDTRRTERTAMTTHMTGTHEEWLAARLALLEAEKELTRRSDELARRRQELPWVRVDKAYRFETDEGSASLADLFRGRSQLLVYHFMFGPDYKAGCATCSTIADGFGGSVVHLANHDVTLSAVSQAPLAKLQAFKRRMGWTFPWASSLGNDFNFDFNVSITKEQQREGGVEYNYRRGGHAMVATTAPEPVIQNAAMAGTDAATYMRERPGMSAFVLDDGVVYHTYSTYARGLDGLWGMYQWLDRAPKGRNETGVWWRHHDMYDKR